MNTSTPPTGSTAAALFESTGPRLPPPMGRGPGNRVVSRRSRTQQVPILMRRSCSPDATYVPEPHQVPIGIWSGVEDEQYTKQPDEPMAEFDAEVPIHSGKDSEEALMVLTKRRAEIRDARSVSSVRLLFTVYELVFRNGGNEESNVGKKTRKCERSPSLK